MRTPLCIMPLLSALACGPGPRHDAAPPLAAPGSASPATPARAAGPLSLAQGLSEQAYQSGTEAAELAVAAAFFASADQQRLTLTGTVRTTSQGSSYAADPTDRMQVDLPDGAQWSFEFIQQQGSSASAQAFMSGDHVLHIRARGPGGFDAEVHSRRQARQRQARIRGTAASATETYDFDLSYEGTEDFESDSTGVSYRADLSVAGTVRTAGFELVASERWRFELVSGTGAGAYAANTAERVQDGHLTVDGRVYDYRGLITRRAFRDGKPTEVDTYWRAEGLVLQDGEPWGQAELQTTVTEAAGTGAIQFVLQTPAGPVIMESWRVY